MIVPKGSSDASPSIRRSVVVLDDDQAVLSALKFALELEGMDVRGYRTVDALYREIALRPVDCLVIDYVLPGENGFAVLKALRAMGITAPAIVITTAPNAATRRAAADSGIWIVEKPLLGSALPDAIRGAIAMRSA